MNPTHKPALPLPPVRDYAAYDPGAPHLAMGLHALDLDEWIEVDERLPRDLAEKRHLLRERHADVFAALPAAEAGARETLMLLAGHLPARYPQAYARTGNRLANLATQETWNLAADDLHPLELAARLVQEDLCLMRSDEGDGAYRLAAACLCFPTRWLLAEKMGRSLGDIHDPVPGYDAALAAPMDRLFARMNADRPVWRINWSLLDDPALFQPGGHGRTIPAADITPHNAGDRLWLRMERQTLRRLPASRDILFTIRIYVQPLCDLAQQPPRAAQLAATLRSVDPGMAAYKGLSPFGDAALAWLDRMTGA
jgi:dimethylamine monooxygenase subunit A